MRLVYAHFGSKIPKHLRLNLIRTSTLFPNHQCILITDQEVPTFQDNITYVKVVRDKTWDYIDSRLSHPKEFRRNFWFTSLIRFIEVAKFSSESNEKIIHIESDVIVSSDLPLDKFENIDTALAYPIFNREMGVASILFVNGKMGGEVLFKACFQALEKNEATTDMFILGEIAQLTERNVTVLPSFVQTNNSTKESNLELLEVVTQNIEYFNGIFDGLEIGQYFFGIDSRNHRGIRIFRRPNVYGFLSVASAEYVFDNNREFPYMIGINKSLWPLYSIHIHSKDVRAFKINNKIFLQKYMLREKWSEGKSFEYKVFLLAVLKSFYRRCVFIHTKLHGD